jgi:hypothetical protein
MKASQHAQASAAAVAATRAKAKTIVKTHVRIGSMIRASQTNYSRTAVTNVTASPRHREHTRAVERVVPDHVGAHRSRRANAVTGMRYDATEIARGVSEVLA